MLKFTTEIFNLKIQLLRLRDEIESAREALKNEDPEAREQAIGKCSSFLLKESEKIVALQVKPSFKFKSNKYFFRLMMVPIYRIGLKLM